VSENMMLRRMSRFNAEKVTKNGEKCPVRSSVSCTFHEILRSSNKV